MLAGQTSPEQARAMLEVNGEESRRLGRVLEEFSDYARPPAPRMERVEVAPLLQATLREAALAGLGMQARVDVDGARGAREVVADPDQLRRAFANLVRNAREAAGPDGHLTISVVPAGEHVAIRFEDDGPGLPAGDPAALFEPFHTSKRGGLGLGLALVQRVVDAHRGEIRVKRLPRGAAFTIVLPAGERENRA